MPGGPARHGFSASVVQFARHCGQHCSPPSQRVCTAELRPFDLTSRALPSLVKLFDFPPLAVPLHHPPCVFCGPDGDRGEEAPVEPRTARRRPRLAGLDRVHHRGPLLPLEVGQLQRHLGEAQGQAATSLGPMSSSPCRVLGQVNRGAAPHALASHSSQRMRGCLPGADCKRTGP